MWHHLNSYVGDDTFELKDNCHLFIYRTCRLAQWQVRTGLKGQNKVLDDKRNHAWVLLCICCIWMNVWICESINVWMYDCMNECKLYDCIYCMWYMNLVRQRHVRLEADWQRSTNTRQPPLKLMLLWTNRALSIESLGEVAICKWAQSVLPSTCFNNHVFLFSFLKIPDFCLDRTFGFSVHQECIPFLCP